MADPLFVLLVSGMPEGGDQGFAKCAWLRVAELVDQFFRTRATPTAVVKADSVLRFIHFDSHTGSVLIYEHDFATQKGKVRDPLGHQLDKNWTVLDANFVTAHGPLDAKHDPPNWVAWQAVADAKAAGSRTPLSIVDVYHSVRKAARGSVLELSIFSHAFVDGPVLFNTPGPAAGSTQRSSTDTDGRAAIDFRPDMGESGAANAKALEEFQKGFAPTGSFRIWGCNIQDIVVTLRPDGVTARALIMSTVREVTDAAYVQQLRRGGAVAKLLRDTKKLPPGNTKISLDMNREIIHERELQSDPHAGHGFTKFTKDRLFEIRYAENQAGHAYAAFFRNEKDAHGDFAKTIVRTLSDVVTFVAAETVPSYFFAAARALKTVTVVGGAPGTSAEIDGLGQQYIGPARLDQARFFSKFFGVSITDPEARVQRHYAFLDNQGTAVATILDRAAHGLP
jgi:hypothetical protein